MPNEEEKLYNLAATGGFVLFILLLSSYFDYETVIIVLLGMIYTKMR